MYNYKENQDQKEKFHEETRGIRQLLILRDSKSKKRESVKLMHGMGMGEDASDNHRDRGDVARS